MRKIRIGNDFALLWKIRRGEQAEDLTEAQEMSLKLWVQGDHNSLKENIPFDIFGSDTVRVEVTPSIADKIGRYRFEFKYQFVNLSNADKNQKCAVDVEPFYIVPLTDIAETINTVNCESDVLIGLRGRAFVYDDFTPEQIVDLKQPAIDAGLIAKGQGDYAQQQGDYAKTQGTRAENATDNINASFDGWESQESDRVTSELTRKANEDDRVDSEAIRKTNETVRKNSEIDRIDAEADRKSSEATRKSNETARINNEAIRESNESQRKSNEVGRVNAESDRVDAEITREQQEKARQTNTATAITNAENAITDVNAAKDDYYDVVKPDIIAQGNLAQEQGEFAQQKGSELTLDLAVVKREVKQNQAILSTINSNQEAKQSIEGASPLNLPINAGEGNAQFNLKGLTATNLVENGDFRNGLSGWGLSGTLVNGKLKLKATAPNVAAFASNSYVSDWDIGNKIYSFVKLDVISGYETTNNYIILRVGDRGSAGNFCFFSRTVLPKGIHTLSRITIADKTGQLFYGIYDMDSIAEVDFLGIINIDLTATFGAGNEPTKEWCDEHFADYFEGTQSVDAPVRVKSVSQDGLKQSNLYIDGNTKLRSLPNSVKDEIRSDGKGGYEMVKRISDLGVELAEPIITPLITSGSLISRPNGTVYVENVVANAGVYTTKYDVTIPTLKIKSIESITKIDFETAQETKLDVSLAVISDSSFTHPNLANGDIIFVVYEYQNDSLNAPLKVDYYDSRYTVKDSVTDTFYKWSITVADGVPTINLIPA